MNEWRRVAREHLLQRQAAGISPRTLESDAIWLKRFMAWCAQRQIDTPTAVTTADVETFRTELSRTRAARGAFYSTEAVRQAMRALRALFAWAAKREVVLLNPLADMVLGREPRVLPPTLTIHEVECLLEAADDGTLLGMRNHAILETLYGTGIRRSELLGLQLTDLDLQARKLRVMGKGGVERFAPVGETLAGVLERYLQICRPQLAGRMNDPSLFLSANGFGYQNNGLGQMIQRVGKRAGIRVAAHRLRHAFAVHLLECGADFYDVQHLLGHRNPNSTQIYLHIALAAFGRAFWRCHPRGRQLTPTQEGGACT